MPYAPCSLRFALALRLSSRTKSRGLAICHRSSQLEYSARSEPFRRALRELGYTEGENIGIEYRYAGGNKVAQPELAAELVRLKVDIILVAGGDPNNIRAAKSATRDNSYRYVGFCLRSGRGKA